MKIQYLEIVATDVEKTCKCYENGLGVKFSNNVPELGNAKTAKLEGGGLLGVRAPMHESEDPIVRPYLLVDDINQAITKAEKAGAQIAHPPLEIPGFGTFAIYVVNGNHHGLWQL